jgi:hypothetical protein
MSWYAYVDLEKCPTCGRGGQECLEMDNYTHNTNSMMRRAMEAVGTLDRLGEDHLYALNHMPCREALEILDPAIDWWAAQPNGVMDDLNPENGWGHSSSAFEFWKGIRDACKKHPTGVLELHG